MYSDVLSGTHVFFSFEQSFKSNVKQSTQPGVKVEKFHISPPVKESTAGWIYPKAMIKSHLILE